MESAANLGGLNEAIDEAHAAGADIAVFATFGQFSLLGQTEPSVSRLIA
jgi:hypothetical protein